MLLAALTKATEAGLERPGVLRANISTTSPQGLEAIFEELEGAAFDSDQIDVDITFEPLP
jgi:hypothetical protein